MRSLIIILGFLVIHCVNAHEVFPAQCKPLALAEDTPVLNGPPKSMYFIHNTSSVDLWLTHPIADPSASAGFSSRIQSGHWSALVVDKPPFELSCVESKPGHEQQVMCTDTIAVCRWQEVKRPKKFTGTYWAGEDMTLLELSAYIGRRGFILPERN